MMGDQPDMTGNVRSFSGTSIDQSGTPFFEFILTLSPSDCPYPFPLEVVLYVNLTQDNAPAIVTLAVAACAFQFPIDVYLQDSLSEMSRVFDVRRTMSLESLATSSGPVH